MKKTNTVNPQFIIAGAAKAGSTSLATYLSAHPQVYMSAVKEPNYFSGKDIDQKLFRPLMKERLGQFNLEEYLRETPLKPRHTAYIETPEQYQQLYKDAGTKITGEASVSYLWSPSAPSEIFKNNPDTKIIIVLRQPVERAYSHYLMDVRLGYAKKSFPKMVEDDLNLPQKWNASSMYITLGLYSQQLKRYLEKFPSENICIVWYEDFAASPGTVIKSLFRFIGVDENYLPDFSQRENESYLYRNRIIAGAFRYVQIVFWLRRVLGKNVKKKIRQLISTSYRPPALTDEEKKAINEYFREDILELQKITGRDLTAWLKV